LSIRRVAAGMVSSLMNARGGAVLVVAAVLSRRTDGHDVRVRHKKRPVESHVPVVHK